MRLNERTYSVLAVSAGEKLNIALRDLLPESRYDPVRFVSNVSAAKREWAERGYDFVIVNSPLPDDAGMRFAIDAGTASNAVVLLMVRDEIYVDVREKVSEYGVFTVPKPVNRSSVSLALDWMASARERLRKLEKKTISFEEKMEEIRLVNRAKWVLISNLKMEEPQAHRYIEKQAMDRCVSRREVAEEIIRTYT